MIYTFGFILPFDHGMHFFLNLEPCFFEFLLIMLNMRFLILKVKVDLIWIGIDCLDLSLFPLLTDLVDY